MEEIEVDENQNSSSVGTESSRPAQAAITIPDISLQPRHGVLQTLVSRDTWVRVSFFGKEPPTKAEIFRTMELLEMMHSGWS